MSLRLAVKRSLDDAARDDSDIRDAAVIMEALQGLSVADLKRFLHPIRSASLALPLPALALPPTVAMTLPFTHPLFPRIALPRTSAVEFPQGPAD